MVEESRIPIRSYRLCFALERRIHKIDRWRIPVPFGVPLRGIGYGAVVLLAILVLGRLPGIGLLVGALHPALRLVVLPMCSAYLLCRWEIDGRPAHAGLASWARLLLSPRRLVGLRGAPADEGVVRFGEITLAPDDSSVRLRRGVVRGPATAVLRYPVKTRTVGHALHVTASPGEALWRGKQVTLRRGERLVLR